MRRYSTACCATNATGFAARRACLPQVHCGRQARQQGQPGPPFRHGLVTALYSVPDLPLQLPAEVVNLEKTVKAA